MLRQAVGDQVLDRWKHELAKRHDRKPNHAVQIRSAVEQRRSHLLDAIAGEVGMVEADEQMARPVLGLKAMKHHRVCKVLIPPCHEVKIG